MKTKIAITLPLLFLLAPCLAMAKSAKPQSACYNCTDIQYLTSRHFAISNPALVTNYASKPNIPYTKVATITVSHMNSAGIKRSAGVINDIMKNDAAMLGGNGLMNIQRGKTADSATVVHLTLPGTEIEPSYTPV
ncbi:MAG: hypothetical protein CMF39_03030 [Legionellaceae bacterium]|nr:hypothetical protein [Legionellaceae bacterium]|tara:strand:+ start:575 stop:979 length:405 start_codon:yes stop_codon:yes gene_type:complete